MRVNIIAGSLIDDYDWLKDQLQSNDFLICADSGADHARKIQMIPNIVVGDFDAIDVQTLEHYKNIDDVQVIEDSDTNTTDLTKALNCLPEGASEVHIYGALGGRRDHEFSNYLILQSYTNNNIVLKSSTGEVRVLHSDYKFSANEGDHVGVFPLNKVTSLSYKGLLYPANSFTDNFDFGFNGACNIVEQEACEIMLKSGSVLFMLEHNNQS